MLKLSGLVLDFYDDQPGDVLRSIFPTPESVPDLVKQAHVLTPEESAALEDESFALVAISGDVSFRKFACTDIGNTALSVEYFLKTGHKLPAEAQKVAAQNLVRACGWYDIEPPEELSKIAIGLATLLVAPSVVKGTTDQINKNMGVARASGSVVNPAVRAG